MPDESDRGGGDQNSKRILKRPPKEHSRADVYSVPIEQQMTEMTMEDSSMRNTVEPSICPSKQFTLPHVHQESGGHIYNLSTLPLKYDNTRRSMFFGGDERSVFTVSIEDIAEAKLEAIIIRVRTGPTLLYWTGAMLARQTSNEDIRGAIEECCKLLIDTVPKEDMVTPNDAPPPPARFRSLASVAFLKQHFIDLLLEPPETFKSCVFYCRLCDFHMSNVAHAKDHMTQGQGTHFPEEEKFYGRQKLVQSVPELTSEHYSRIEQGIQEILSHRTLLVDDKTNNAVVGERIVKVLKEIVEGLRVGEEVSLEVYGSTLLGTDCNESDINLSLSVPNVEIGEVEELMDQIQKELTKKMLDRNMEPSFKWNFNTLSLTFKWGSTVVDLRWKQENYLNLCRDLYLLTRARPFLVPFMRIVRYWARLSGLVEDCSGQHPGLPIIGFDLMAIHFLQVLGHVPIVQKKSTLDTDDGAVDVDSFENDLHEILENCGFEPKDLHLGKLFVDFVKYYVKELNFVCVQITEKGEKLRTDMKWNKKNIMIIAPFCPDNVAGRLSRSGQIHIHNVFVYTLCYLCVPSFPEGKMVKLYQKMQESPIKSKSEKKKPRDEAGGGRRLGGGERGQTPLKGGDAEEIPLNSGVNGEWVRARRELIFKRTEPNEKKGVKPEDTVPVTVEDAVTVEAQSADAEQGPSIDTQESETVGGVITLEKTHEEETEKEPYPVVEDNEEHAGTVSESTPSVSAEGLDEEKDTQEGSVEMCEEDDQVFHVDVDEFDVDDHLIGKYSRESLRRISRNNPTWIDDELWNTLARNRINDRQEEDRDMEMDMIAYRSRLQKIGWTKNETQSTSTPVKNKRKKDKRKSVNKEDAVGEEGCSAQQLDEVISEVPMVNCVHVNFAHVQVAEPVVVEEDSPKVETEEEVKTSEAPVSLTPVHFVGDVVEMDGVSDDELDKTQESVHVQVAEPMVVEENTPKVETEKEVKTIEASAPVTPVHCMEDVVEMDGVSDDELDKTQESEMDVVESVQMEEVREKGNGGREEVVLPVESGNDKDNGVEELPPSPAVGQRISYEQFFIHVNVPMPSPGTVFTSNVIRSLDYDFSNPQNFNGGYVLDKKCTFCESPKHLKEHCPQLKIPDYKPIARVLPQETLDALNDVIRQTFERTSLKPTSFNHVRGIVDNLEKYLTAQFGQDVRLTLFGSFENCFGVEGSDVDICLRFESDTKPEKLVDADVITKLSFCLDDARRMRKECNGAFCRHIQAITNAKVPIVKFMLMNNAFNVEADISYYNCLALHNTSLLKKYCEWWDGLSTLGVWIKTWAKQAGIGDAAKGSLSSYAYVILLIHFLQSIDVLPVLQDSECLPDDCERVVFEGHDVTYATDLDELKKKLNWQPPTKSLAELFIDFLDYYCRFNFEKTVVQMRRKKPLLVPEKQSDELVRDMIQWRHKRIYIEDPFDHRHNLPCGISERMYVYIMRTFHRARDAFGTEEVQRQLKEENVHFVGGNERESRIALLSNRYISAASMPEPPPDLKCKSCFQFGHYSNTCPKYNRQNGSTRGGRGGRGDRRGGRGGGDGYGRGRPSGPRSGGHGFGVPTNFGQQYDRPSPTRYGGRRGGGMFPGGQQPLFHHGQSPIHSNAPTVLPGHPQHRGPPVNRQATTRQNGSVERGKNWKRNQKNKNKPKDLLTGEDDVILVNNQQPALKPLKNTPKHKSAEPSKSKDLTKTVETPKPKVTAKSVESAKSKETSAQPKKLLFNPRVAAAMSAEALKAKVVSEPVVPPAELSKESVKPKKVPTPEPECASSAKKGAAPMVAEKQRVFRSKKALQMGASPSPSNKKKK